MTTVFANFPVTDLPRSIVFYEALGFQKNEEFSNEQASALVWDDTFWVMLLTTPFYEEFLSAGKVVADTKKVSGALVAFTVDSVEKVKELGRLAEQHGGRVRRVNRDIPEELMYELEIEDPDGNQLEPCWLKS
ncbi:MAG: VOC family protein [Enterococcus italicus]|uniref:Glyoxalase family protein n=1 Tax=Enterococcus italicus (strain DSM 15952 / CCUG 50447 / LMG 22039 / TP 1.5) TaxID=888064 RepID=E6LF21_ENTI1|nr:VOC family protein [Enterococcus italicus]EFU74194.1 glyoxalase family protein [Enterococcus italicus DSM 15952]OJG59910.1 glyoxalase [Enterococcus italicus DSM 15952]